MTEIIDFNSYKSKRRSKQSNQISDAERLKALVKGRIEEYDCPYCGSTIEVINGIKPEKCPNCNLMIAW